MRIVLPILAVLSAMSAAGSPVRAAVILHEHERRIPLNNGAIPTEQIVKAMLEELGLGQLIPHTPGTIDFNTPKGQEILQNMNAALDKGIAFRVQDNELVMRVINEKLPGNWDDTRVLLRKFVAAAAPDVFAAQQRHWGLLLPQTIDPRRPLVVLVHGLDTNRDCWGSVEALLKEAGYQTALFGYPGDGPIMESAQMLAQNVAELRRKYPGLKLDFVTHSMGGLVCRAFIEGPDYDDSVDRLIMLAPPNHGTTWAPLTPLLKIRANVRQWQTDKDYQLSWALTEGWGEAARDLTPGSKFLQWLEKRPRSSSVKYTIIAGSRAPGWRMGAQILEATANCVPDSAKDWWGVKQLRGGLGWAAEGLRQHQSDSDGPVSIESAKLAGVDDFTVLPVDHLELYAGCDGHGPAAWPIIKDRLAGKDPPPIHHGRKGF